MNKKRNQKERETKRMNDKDAMFKLKLITTKKCKKIIPGN